MALTGAASKRQSAANPSVKNAAAARTGALRNRKYSAAATQMPSTAKIRSRPPPTPMANQNAAAAHRPQNTMSSATVTGHPRTRDRKTRIQSYTTPKAAPSAIAPKKATICQAMESPMRA